MKRLLSLVAVALGAALLASGCSSTTGPVAASVNGTELSRADLEADLEALAGNKDFVKYLNDEQGFELVPSTDGMAAAATASWLSSLVTQVIVDDEFERRNLKITDAQRADAEQAIAQSQTFGGPEVFGKFPKAFRDELVEGQARTAALATALAEQSQTTEAELLQLYDANKDAFCPSGKLVSHILVDTPEAAAAVEDELAGGADFAELARTRSGDPDSAPVGGVLTCVDSQVWPQYPESVRSAVVPLSVGEVSAPVQTEAGYHVIKVTDFTFESARPFLEATVQQQQQNLLPDFVARKLAKAKLTVDPRYGRVVSDDQGTRIEPPATPEPRTRPTSATTTTTVPLQGGSPEGSGGSTGSP